VIQIINFKSKTMEKRNLFSLTLLLLLPCLFGLNNIVAQTIVGTDPENKNVILEEFTGIHCTYCPQGHQIAQGIQNANPGVVLINIHTGSYANPSGGEPDFRTSWGDAIAGQSGLTGYPAGTVNRHIFSGLSQGSGTAMSRGNWSSASSQILAQASYANVGLESYINVETRELTVNVEVYYTADSPESTNLINVAILQDSIYGPQTGGGAGNNYNHMHMLRHLVTGQWGLEITTTTAGTLYQNTLTYTIPNDYNDVEVILEHLEVVGFITETSQELISGSRGTVSFSGGPDPLTAGFEAEETQFCDAGTAHYSNISTGDPIQYLWTFEGGNPETSELMNPNVYYADLGEYDVTLIVRDAAGNTDTTVNVDFIKVITCVGVDEEADRLALDVFPNPSQGIVKLNIVADMFNTAELKVIDAMGKVVYQQSNIQVNGSLTKEIDLTGYPQGIYFITVSGDDKQVSKKIFLRK
jgi:PKD repeat protein